MKRPNGLRAFLWTLVLGYTALHLGYSIFRYSILEGAASGDFNRVYVEAMEWKSSLNASAQGWHFHPPFYHAILLSVDALAHGMKNVAAFFYFIQFLLFPLAVAFLVRAAWLKSEKPPWTAYGAATVLAVNFQPFLETLAQHKVEGIEFFLICAAILLFRRGKDLWSGGSVMLAANLKYLPALLLVHFGVKREWKALRGSAIGLALIFGMLYAGLGRPLPISGFLGKAAGLMMDHQHEGNRPEASVEMQTLSGTVNRWFARPVPPTPFMHYIRVGTYMPVSNPALALGIAQWLKGLAVIGWLLLIRRKWKNADRESRWPLHLLEISLTLVMLLVISQASRVHYSILVLPGFLITGLLLFQNGPAFSRGLRMLFGLAYALTGMLIPGGLLNRLPPHPVWEQRYSLLYLWGSLPFYGILLLGLCIALMHRRMLKQGSHDA